MAGKADRVRSLTKASFNRDERQLSAFASLTFGAFVTVESAKGIEKDRTSIERKGVFDTKFDKINNQKANSERGEYHTPKLKAKAGIKYNTITIGTLKDYLPNTISVAELREAWQDIMTERHVGNKNSANSQNKEDISMNEITTELKEKMVIDNSPSEQKEQETENRKEHSIINNNNNELNDCANSQGKLGKQEKDNQEEHKGSQDKGVKNNIASSQEKENSDRLEINDCKIPIDNLLSEEQHQQFLADKIVLTSETELDLMLSYSKHR